MKQKSLVVGIVLCVCFLLPQFIYAQEKGVEDTVQELTQELTQATELTQEELDSVNEPVKNMLKRGAKKEDMHQILGDLSQQGLRGKEFKQSVESMNELVNEGESPKDAGNIVSEAAHQAQLEGLQGKELADRVHQAIQMRKAEQQQLKEEKKVEKDKEQKEDKKASDEVNSAKEKKEKKSKGKDKK